MDATERKRLWRQRNAERERLYTQTYRARNADREAERVRQWREANRDRERQYQQDWYQRNRERVLAQQKESYQANLEANRLRKISAAEKRRSLTVGDLTTEEWQEILEEFDHRCAYCQGQGALAMEHLTPVSRGGRHTRSNVVPACKSCNSSKGAKTLLEFASIVPVKLRVR